ncbi:sulfatase [Tsukamurella sp. 8F]|uniref:sulfatase family protein n=1 Tax=unclassified Tsukamurella TaxID=2633480 RepID=UPI0023B9E12D|nr:MULTISPECIES: sulfatase [unclassified Tsukamurella]MDF0528396.1 sulfatase [Tsukamurella sp. 8J]MDF0586221.1 sulfatase [Tsukamurella sp. 8F]
MASGAAHGRDNVILVHWHDLGRHLACYGAEGVRSPNLDRLAGEGIRFTDAHATAPLCSPARGSLFTGQYPHRNGLVGLAHHGFAYRDHVRTLPALLGDAGYHTALFGMQHESTDPSTLGFDEVDVSDSLCDYVTARAQEWLGNRADDDPFLLTAGFFETHRPYEAYEPADPADVVVPGWLPDDDRVRADLAGVHGSIAEADAAVGRLLDTVAELGLDDSTWIVFVTDHGLAMPRAKSTLYAEGTGVALIVRPPRRRAIAPRVYGDLFSGVDLTPTVLELLGLPIPTDVDGESHAPEITSPAGDPVREELFTEKTYHDAYDPIRAVRTKQFSYIENYAARPALLLPLDIADSPTGQAIDVYEASAPRARRELYDLVVDPYERRNVIDEPAYRWTVRRLSADLARWRRETADVLPDEAEGTAIAERFMTEFFATRDAEAGEALPSRRPHGENRELTRVPAPAGGVTAADTAMG